MLSSVSSSCTFDRADARTFVCRRGILSEPTQKSFVSCSCCHCLLSLYCWADFELEKQLVLSYLHMKTQYLPVVSFAVYLMMHDHCFHLFLYNFHTMVELVSTIQISSLMYYLSFLCIALCDISLRI